MIDFTKYPALKRLLETLAKHHPDPVQQKQLYAEAGIGGENPRRQSDPLNAEGLVRTHRTTTHVVWTITDAGLEAVRAGLDNYRGNSGYQLRNEVEPVRHSGAGPTAPSAENDRVADAERLVEIEREQLKLTTERGEILRRLSSP